MIVAGIDEAGYGPLLGPLVVGCCAFELSGDEDDAAGELPCLWKRLRRVVSKSRDKSGRKIHVNDSKLVYSTSMGLRELERAVLALAASAGHAPADLVALLAWAAEGAWEHLSACPWYAGFPGEVFPLEQEATSIRLLANGLRAEMERSATRCIHLAAKVMPERQLNQQLEHTHNKSSVLFTLAAGHLDHLLRTYGQRQLTIYCDRQGGREHYGRLLRLMFEDWSLEIVGEEEGRCEYCLRRVGHAVRLLFREKAESQCLPVAAASMLSKYLREALMRRFNAYWRALLPELAPTAGYYTDGQRFLKDIDAKRREMGITDADLIRMR